MTKYQVTVVNTNSAKPLPLIKALRVIGHLGLKSAKELAEFMATTSPCTLVAGIDRDVAEHVAKLLYDAGATSAVQESTAKVPLFLCPEANKKCRWSWLGGRTPV